MSKPIVEPRHLKKLLRSVLQKENVLDFLVEELVKAECDYLKLTLRLQEEIALADIPRQSYWYTYVLLEDNYIRVVEEYPLRLEAKRIVALRPDYLSGFTDSFANFKLVTFLPCKIIEPLLHNYVYELTGRIERQQIRNHLEACKECFSKFIGFYKARGVE